MTENDYNNLRKKDQEVEIYGFCKADWEQDGKVYQFIKNEYDDVIVFKAVLGEYVYAKYDHQGKSNEETDICEYIYPWNVIKEIILK